MTLTDAIKATVDIPTACAWLGIDPPHRGRMNCPSPDHADRKADATFDASRGLWFCFRCSVGGSVIDLVAIASGISAARAIAWLADRARLRDAPTHRPTTADARRQALRRRVTNELHRALWDQAVISPPIPDHLIDVAAYVYAELDDLRGDWCRNDTPDLQRLRDYEAWREWAKTIITDRITAHTNAQTIQEKEDRIDAFGDLGYRKIGAER